jgi:hypothetical protein
MDCSATPMTSRSSLTYASGVPSLFAMIKIMFLLEYFRDGACDVRLAMWCESAAPADFAEPFTPH